MPRLSPLIWILILILVAYVLFLYPYVVVLMVGYILIHEAIHWITRYCLTGEFAKVGFVGFYPCVYSNDFTTRNNAIAQTAAPLITITLIILIGLGIQLIDWKNIELLFVLNIGGSCSDVGMVFWYLKYPNAALCGDDSKKNYILMPKKG